MLMLPMIATFTIYSGDTSCTLAYLIRCLKTIVMEFEEQSLEAVLDDDP
jgi:hypothetical protein